MTEENWKTNNCISEKNTFESPLEKPTLTKIELRENIRETEWNKFLKKEKSLLSSSSKASLMPFADYIKQTMETEENKVGR